MPRLRDDGRWVIADAVAGPVVELDLRRLYLHNIQLIGSSMHTRVHFAKLVEMARAGSISPSRRRTLRPREHSQRPAEFQQGRHVGKIVITP